MARLETVIEYGGLYLYSIEVKSMQDMFEWLAHDEKRWLGQKPHVFKFTLLSTDWAAVRAYVSDQFKDRDWVWGECNRVRVDHVHVPASVYYRSM